MNLQVVYFGLHIITPLITLELLKYPKLCFDVRLCINHWPILSWYFYCYNFHIAIKFCSISRSFHICSRFTPRRSHSSTMTHLAMYLQQLTLVFISRWSKILFLEIVSKPFCSCFATMLTQIYLLICLSGCRYSHNVPESSKGSCFISLQREKCWQLWFGFTRCWTHRSEWSIPWRNTESIPSNIAPLPSFWGLQVLKLYSPKSLKSALSNGLVKVFLPVSCYSTDLVSTAADALFPLILCEPNLYQVSIYCSLLKT